MILSTSFVAFSLDCHDFDDYNIDVVQMFGIKVGLNVRFRPMLINKLLLYSSQACLIQFVNEVEIEFRVILMVIVWIIDVSIILLTGSSFLIHLYRSYYY